MSKRRKRPTRKRRRGPDSRFQAGIISRIENTGPARRVSVGEEACVCLARFDAFVEGTLAKERSGEDYEDFFVEAPVPDSAIEAMLVAMQTGVPQSWECEHGQRHLSGLFVERTGL